MTLASRNPEKYNIASHWKAVTKDIGPLPSNTFLKRLPLHLQEQFKRLTRSWSTVQRGKKKLRLQECQRPFIKHCSPSSYASVLLSETHWAGFPVARLIHIQNGRIVIWERNNCVLFIISHRDRINPAEELLELCSQNICVKTQGVLWCKSLILYNHCGQKELCIQCHLKNNW